MMKKAQEDLLMRLQRLDEDADLIYEGPERFQITLVGGSALILLNCSVRLTYDINVLELPEVLFALVDKYDINDRAHTYASSFAGDYQERLLPLWRGRKIDFFLASLEDIVISKLCSARVVDGADVKSRQVVRALNWPLLDRLAYNLQRGLVDPGEKEFFTTNYLHYLRRYRPCAN